MRVSVVEVGVDGTLFDLETPLLAGRLRTPLAGAHQAWNAALAVRAAELLDAELGAVELGVAARGLAAVRWPGRLERLRAPGGRAVLLDGCHNPDGARALSRFLADANLTGRCPLVFGAMADKDVEGIASILFPAASRVVLVPASPPRGARSRGAPSPGRRASRRAFRRPAESRRPSMSSRRGPPGRVSRMRPL